MSALLPLIPLVTAVLLLIWPRPLVAIGGALAGIVTVATLYRHHPASDSWARFDVEWLPRFDVRLHFAVDGLSWPLLALTALLLLCCAIWQTVRGFDATLLAWCCIVVAAANGVFLARDVIVFVVCFELVVLPMYLIIARYGGQGAAAAARTFALFSMAGSVLLVAGAVLLVARAGTSDIASLTDTIPAGAQLLVFVVLTLAFAVKAPLWPLHTWLPKAHTAAPTVGSVLLAGVLLKLGSYGFIRLAIAPLPDAARRAAFTLAVISVAAIVVTVGVCLLESEFKRLIAFSSVGHMGFVMLGAASLNEAGLQAAQLANVAHGLTTGLLFFCVDAVKHRASTGLLHDLGGLRQSAPRWAGILVFAAAASFGLPGLAGFWGEAFALVGAADHHSVGWWAVTAIAALGAAGTVGYLLRMLRRVTVGARRTWPDISAGELTATAPLLVAILLLGVWPGAVADLTAGPVSDIVAAVTR